MVMLAARRGNTQRCGAPGEGAGLTGAGSLGRLRPGTPLSLWTSATLSVRVGGELSSTSRKIAFTSSGAAVCGRRDRTIRRNIIGRSMPVFRQQIADAGRPLCAWRALPLFDQPASEHGCRVFLHPLIEKRSNLLAKIGRMAETRKFIALERIARSREQELPRGLSSGPGHLRLLWSNRRTVTEQ